MNLPSALEARCAEVLGTSILKISYVGGGDISEARLLECSKGPFFLKYRSGPEAESLFETEARGLELLRAPGVIRIPRVLGHGTAGPHAFLLLEYIKPGYSSDRFWERFGQNLARLHRHSADSFGLEFDNFIGRLPQANAFRSNWVDFYREMRLQPQFQAAFEAGLLNNEDARSMERLFHRLPDLLPPEPPALIHGDLWSGNYLVAPDGSPVLIDPSVCFGNREMDLAMSRLFGGFHWRFYQSYEEAYPLPSGLEDRIPVYQLYYLLVHVNLFGSSYTGPVRSILKPFLPH